MCKRTIGITMITMCQCNFYDENINRNNFVASIFPYLSRLGMEGSWTQEV